MALREGAPTSSKPLAEIGTIRKEKMKRAERLVTGGAVLVIGGMIFIVIGPGAGMAVGAVMGLSGVASAYVGARNLEKLNKADTLSG